MYVWMPVCVSKNLPAITAFITARKKKCNQKLNNEQQSWSFERKQKTHSYCYFSLPFCFILYWLISFGLLWAPLRFSSCCSQFLKDDFDYKNCLLLTRNLHKQKHFGAEILIHCFFKATNLILNCKKIAISLIFSIFLLCFG